MMWECGICEEENQELAESCQSCEAEHITVTCCENMRPVRRTHMVHTNRVCGPCMSVNDYHDRIDKIANVFESNAWLAKHALEIEERPQEFIEAVISRFYDHHFALQDSKDDG